jgi:hypothetical protein
MVMLLRFADLCLGAISVTCPPLLAIRDNQPDHIWFRQCSQLWTLGVQQPLGEVEIFRMDNQLNRAKQHGNGQNVPFVEWLLWKN